MKIYLVNKDIDLGYHVQKVYLSEEKANECAQFLRKQYIEDNKYFNPLNVWVEEMEVIE